MSVAKTPPAPPLPAAPTADGFDHGSRSAGANGERIAPNLLPGYTSSSEPLRLVLDELINRYTTDNYIEEESARRSLEGFLRSPMWLAADTRTRRKLLDVALLLNSLDSDPALLSKGRSGLLARPLESFVTLMNDGRLLSRGDDGKSMLDNLHRLAKAGLGQRAIDSLGETSTKDVLSDLVMEIADPGRIDQSGASTCTMTSVSHALLTTDPGEYARLTVELLVVGGVRLRDGTLVNYWPDQVERTRTSSPTNPFGATLRTASERVLQSTLMAYAYPDASYTSNHLGEKDEFERYDHDTHVLATFPGWLQALCWILFPIGLVLHFIPFHRRWAGVEEERIARVMEAVFAEPFSCVSIGGDLRRLDALADRSGRMRDRRIVVSFDEYGEDSELGHALNLVAIDRATTPPSLICRDPGGSFWIDVDGQRAIGAREEVTYLESTEGTVRVSMTPRMLESLDQIIVPKSALKSR